MVDHYKSSEKHLKAQQAKEFLISKILEEARMENAPLSEVERKMLHFTETEEMSPDMVEANEQFEREYDSAEYENKISSLLINAHERFCQETPDNEHRWKHAIADLRKEDHYLLVMVDQANRSARRTGDRVTLWTTAFVVVGVILGAELLAAKYNVDLDKYFPSRDTLSFVIWGTMAGLAVIYAVLSLLFGRRRTSDLIANVVESVFQRSNRSK
jgi:hypothetical protein